MGPLPNLGIFGDFFFVFDLRIQDLFLGHFFHPFFKTLFWFLLQSMQVFP